MPQPIHSSSYTDLPISDFMNRNVLSGGVETPLRQVVESMRRRTESAFVVCQERVPIGVITERDTLEVLDDIFSGCDREPPSAGSVMASPVHTLPETASMSEVIQIMKERYFRRVPIVDESNELTGIVNLVELQAAMNEVLEKRSHDLEQAVQARTEEFRVANEKLQKLSRHDELTGLLNRRAMAEKLEELHVLAGRYGNPYSIIICDIDYFKPFNDTLGHLHGDSVLRSVAQALTQAVRLSDSAYRYGGEEFVVALPETDRAGGYIAAERIQWSVARKAIPHPESSVSDHVTLSFGVSETRACDSENTDSWEHIIERADRALYEAKRRGRNCIVSADEDE